MKSPPSPPRRTVTLSKLHVLLLILAVFGFLFLAAAVRGMTLGQRVNSEYKFTDHVIESSGEAQEEGLFESDALNPEKVLMFVASLPHGISRNFMESYESSHQKLISYPVDLNLGVRADTKFLELCLWLLSQSKTENLHETQRRHPSVYFMNFDADDIMRSNEFKAHFLPQATELIYSWKALLEAPTSDTLILEFPWAGHVLPIWTYVFSLCEFQPTISLVFISEPGPTEIAKSISFQSHNSFLSINEAKKMVAVYKNMAETSCKASSTCKFRTKKLAGEAQRSFLFDHMYNMKDESESLQLMKIEREAYVTIVTSKDKDYILSAIILGLSISLQDSARDRVVLMTDQAPGEESDFMFEALGWKIRRIPSVPEVWFSSSRCKYAAHGMNQGTRWGRMSSKLRLFDLEEYDRVFYLDTDVVVTGDIAKVFSENKAFDPNWPGLELIGEGGTGHKYVNAGALLVKPDKDTFKEIIKYAEDNPPPGIFPNLVDCTEQSLFNAFYLSRMEVNKVVGAVLKEGPVPVSLVPGISPDEVEGFTIARMESVGECDICIAHPDVSRNFSAHIPLAIHFVRVDVCPKPWKFAKTIKQAMLSQASSEEDASASIIDYMLKPRLDSSMIMNQELLDGDFDRSSKSYRVLANFSRTSLNTRSFFRSWTKCTSEPYLLWNDILISSGVVLS